MSTSPKRKVYIVREAFVVVYGDQPPAIKVPAVWSFDNREEAESCQARLTASRQKHHTIEEREWDAPEPIPQQRGYVVQRLCWQYNDSWNDLADDEPLKAFRDRELAEIYRLDLEEAERERLGGPGWNYLMAVGSSSLSEDEIRRRLVELGISPPDNGFEESEWWRNLQEAWSRRIYHQVWDLFDGVRFYEILEVELGS